MSVFCLLSIAHCLKDVVFDIIDNELPSAFSYTRINLE